jgi:hypothetical protein
LKTQFKAIKARAVSVSTGAPQRHAACHRGGKESGSSADTIFRYVIPGTLNNKRKTQQPKKAAIATVSGP